MEDKTYIEALMSTPSRDEQDKTLKQALQSDDFAARRDEKIKEFQEKMTYLSGIWKQVKDYLHYWRRHGSARQKREAWKYLHRLSRHRHRGRHYRG